MTSVAIAIITYRRSEMLARLLDSLASQQLEDPERWQVRIVVVDNDAEGSAAATIEQARDRSPWPITYAIEQKPGIPLARQRSVDLCPDDDAVIFVDDDETCPPRWLNTLVDCWADSGADVVTGPVHGILPEDAPAWNAAADVHSSRGKHQTGDRLNKAYTNNTLVTRAVLDAVTPAFDPVFQFTGSSDLHFFLRVHRAGFQIVWCEEAEVTESVPLTRTTPRWHAQRAFRAGAGDTISRRLIRPGPVSVVVSIAYATGRLVTGIGLLLRGMVPGQRRARIKGIRRICSAAGSYAGLVGVNYKEYRR